MDETFDREKIIDCMFDPITSEILAKLEDGKKEDIFGTDGAKNMSEKEKIFFIEEIPLDKEIRESSDKGNPYIFEKPDGITKDIFLKAAKKIEKII